MAKFFLFHAAEKFVVEADTADALLEGFGDGTITLQSTQGPITFAVGTGFPIYARPVPKSSGAGQRRIR